MIPEEARERARTARNALRLCKEATPGRWVAAEKAGKLIVRSAEPFRRGPRKGGYIEFDDVCKVSGGTSAQAEANAEFIAQSRDMLEELALTALALLVNKHGAEVAEPLPGDEYEGDEALPEKVALCTVTMHHVFRMLADLLDDCFAFAGGTVAGLPTSDRNDDPMTRLNSGGYQARRVRAELLINLGEALHPDNDSKRVKELPASARLPGRGMPDIGHLLASMPAEVRAAFSGKPIRSEEELRDEYDNAPQVPGDVAAELDKIDRLWKEKHK